jgi:hypothetical protein
MVVIMTPPEVARKGGVEAFPGFLGRNGVVAHR